MKGIREIKHRIKAVKNTAQITNAMHLVSASKMKRAQDLACKGRSYNLLLAEIISSLSKKIDFENINIKHPFFTKRPVEKRGIVVLGTDRGLCGSLNQNLCKYVNSQNLSQANFIVIGNKPMQYLARMNCHVIAQFCVSDTIKFNDVKNIIEFLTESFQNGTIDSVEVLFSRYKNTLVQEPLLQKLLPMVNFHEEIQNCFRGFESRLQNPPDDRPMIFEPSIKTILDKFPPIFLKKAFYQILLESKASEHSSRMVAMKTATDNAENLIDELSLEFNKIRQSCITQEILEISSGKSKQ